MPDKRARDIKTKNSAASQLLLLLAPLCTVNKLVLSFKQTLTAFRQLLGERGREREKRCKKGNFHPTSASLVAPLCNSETERNDLACKMPQLAGAATANERQRGTEVNLQLATGNWRGN